MKICLINPAYPDSILRKAVVTPPLGLATIASHIPNGFDIQLIDENKQQTSGNEQADLVAISALTNNAPRAYELADKYMARGVRVIIGGVHASVLPKEAKKHCDSVIIGEAENILSAVIRDFSNNKLQDFYIGNRIDIHNTKLPRHDLITHRYKMEAIQTSRGCPNNCDFCSVTSFNGITYRRRSMENIKKEIEMIKSKRIFFVDDNIIGISPKHYSDALSLFKTIRDYNVHWVSQSSINVASDEKLLKAMSDSGCMGLLIGFESINESTLKLMNKYSNLKLGVNKYRQSIKMLHDYGIAVNGSMVIGNDTDSIKSFKNTTDFILDADLDRSQVTISTPLPGTKLFNRMHNEQRIIYDDYPLDWKLYDCSNVVFKPKLMTAEQLQEGFYGIYRETTSMVPTIRRSLCSIKNTGNFMSGLSSLIYNLAMNRAVRNQEKSSFNA